MAYTYEIRVTQAEGKTGQRVRRFLISAESEMGAYAALTARIGKTYVVDYIDIILDSIDVVELPVKATMIPLAKPGIGVVNS